MNGQIDPEPLWVWDYTKAEHKVYTMHGEDLHVLCSAINMTQGCKSIMEEKSAETIA